MKNFLIIISLITILNSCSLYGGKPTSAVKNVGTGGSINIGSGNVSDEEMKNIENIINSVEDTK